MVRRTHPRVRPVLLVLLGVQASCASGPPPPPPEPLGIDALAAHLKSLDPPPPELFASDQPVEFVLAADFERLDGDRSQESENRPAQLLVRGHDGHPVMIPMEVRTRGNFRLQRRNCSDPPLRLDFPVSDTLGTLFDGQDDMKLVTHCRNSDRFEQNVLEEYLAYRLYNLLSDVGFRVQLAEIVYLDSRGKREPLRRMGFLIEDEDAMGPRLQGRMIEAEAANPSDFVLDELGLVYLFQFMIGNVDWGTGTSHNIKILLDEEGYHPIPYDFDWSGLVDAPYAGPNPLTVDLHVGVRERVYWGACLPGMDYDGLFQRFNGVRDGVLALAGRIPGLSDQNRESAVQYLEEFYDVINDPRRAKREIMDACRRMR